MVTENISGPINCACLIHSDGYSWNYVDRLYSMLSRNLDREVLLHVYTEEHRIVPKPYIKHSLLNWGFGGPRRSWWYKLQIFNADYYSGPLLYFDLDTVIVDQINWIYKLNLDYFWSVRDFKRLWRPTDNSINSSIMWFDTSKFCYIWNDFKQKDINSIILQYRGDQDYIVSAIEQQKRRFFELEKVKSWRWQCFDGGYSFEKKQHLAPNTGTIFAPPTSVLIFHGEPKPDKVADPTIIRHWQ